MPFFRAGPGIYFFAHVPKCAGSSVEDYLRDRFGRPGFVDNRFVQRPEAERWTRTSPQHADWATVERLFGPDFFDGAFAVVRHPLSRAVSAYHFQVEVEKTAPAGIGFGDWLQEMRARQAREPWTSPRDPPCLAPPCSLPHPRASLNARVSSYISGQTRMR